ncbi:MAG TPA: hypothetical protein VFJ97_08370 [Dermatophilaceae bacterium]|nr:hypothetical protein [Dermatophilaceae bacterium]
MSAILILVATVVALVAALNASHRRHAGALPPWPSRPSAFASVEDRDVARLRDELRAAQSATPILHVGRPVAGPLGDGEADRVGRPVAGPLGTAGHYAVESLGVTPTSARRTTATACPPPAA